MTNRKNLQMTDGLMVAFLTLIVFLHRYHVLSSDPLLAWPITDSIAHPDRYSSQDLLIQAGVTGNFLLYKSLGYLSVFGDNFPLRDFLIYLPIFFCTLLAWLKVFRELGADRLIAVTALVVLVCSDDKLSLNWAHVVPAYFISATSVQFLQVVGLLWFLKRQRWVALGVTAATGYLHPASALVYGAVYSAIIASDAIRLKSWNEAGPILLFAVIFTPNAMLIVVNSQGAFLAAETYFEVFERYQPQAYLGDHFRLGYAYTLALMAFLYRCHYSFDSWLVHRREVFQVIGVGLIGCAAWLVNLYFLQNLQFIQTFFAMRMFSILHPLLVFLTVATVASLCESSSSYKERVILLLLALTPMLFSPIVALIIVLACTACIRGKAWWPLLFGALLALYLGALILVYDISVLRLRSFVTDAILGLRADNSFNVFQIVVLAASLALLFRTKFPERRSHGYPKGALRLCVLILCIAVVVCGRPALGRLKQAGFNVFSVFNFNPADYWGLRASHREYVELLDWARQSPDHLFSVPPYDDRFLSFRYLSGKGVYIFHRDIAQLMYSPQFYAESARRLVEVAGESPELPKAFMNGEVRRHNGEYEARCRNLLASNQFDIVIFERVRLAGVQCNIEAPVFQNEVYVALRTTGIRMKDKRMHP